MNMKSSLIKLINTGVRRAAKIADRAGQNRHNLGIVVSQSLQKLTSSKDLLFPLAFVELLEDCLKEITLKKIENIKTEFDPKNDVSIKRFSSLIDALRHLPPVEFSSANEIALIADSYRGNLEPIEYDQWASDVRSHFEMSSSFGTKGRILSTVVRFTQARQCLELGTAYGMSALFILEALKTRGKDTHLTTLEAFEPQFSISSKTLKSRYGNQVSCEFGLSQEALPMIVKSLERVDFLFHDEYSTTPGFVGPWRLLIRMVRWVYFNWVNRRIAIVGGAHDSDSMPARHTQLNAWDRGRIPEGQARPLKRARIES